MKLIVAGGRDFTDYQKLCSILNKILEHRTFEVVCGEARGADKLGRKFAEENQLKVHSFPADWDTHGKSAGYIRNKAMAEFSDACVAFWDGKSRGTKHMIDLATQMSIKVIVVKY